MGAPPSLPFFTPTQVSATPGVSHPLQQPPTGTLPYRMPAVAGLAEGFNNMVQNYHTQKEAREKYFADKVWQAIRWKMLGISTVDDQTIMKWAEHAGMPVKRRDAGQLQYEQDAEAYQKKAQDYQQQMQDYAKAQTAARAFDAQRIQQAGTMFAGGPGAPMAGALNRIQQGQPEAGTGLSRPFETAFQRIAAGQPAAAQPGVGAMQAAAGRAATGEALQATQPGAGATMPEAPGAPTAPTPPAPPLPPTFRQRMANAIFGTALPGQVYDTRGLQAIGKAGQANSLANQMFSEARNRQLTDVVNEAKATNTLYSTAVQNKIAMLMSGALDAGPNDPRWQTLYMAGAANGQHMVEMMKMQHQLEKDYTDTVAKISERTGGDSQIAARWIADVHQNHWSPINLGLDAAGNREMAEAYKTFREQDPNVAPGVAYIAAAMQAAGMPKEAIARQLNYGAGIEVGPGGKVTRFNPLIDPYSPSTVAQGFKEREVTAQEKKNNQEIAKSKADMANDVITVHNGAVSAIGANRKILYDEAMEDLKQWGGDTPQGKAALARLQEINNDTKGIQFDVPLSNGKTGHYAVGEAVQVLSGKPLEELVKAFGPGESISGALHAGIPTLAPLQAPAGIFQQPGTTTGAGAGAGAGKPGTSADWTAGLDTGDPATAGMKFLNDNLGGLVPDENIQNLVKDAFGRLYGGGTTASPRSSGAVQFPSTGLSDTYLQDRINRTMQGLTRGTGYGAPGGESLYTPSGPTAPPGLPTQPAQPAGQQPPAQ